MVKVVVATSFLLIGFLAKAQDSSASEQAKQFQGKAEYFSKRMYSKKTTSDNSKKEMDPELEKEFKDALKKATEKRFVLTFNKSEASYEEEQELAKPMVSGETSISISFSGAGKKYINIKDKKTIVEEDMFGKEFVVTDSLENSNWKLIDEIKKIGDYTCFKAELIIPVTEREKQAYKTYLEKTANSNKTKLLGAMEEPKDKIVTAWYTPEIPVSLGPSNYYGLPGFILEVNEEKIVLLCSKVTLNIKSALKIKPPSNGKSVTKKEFNAIEKKKREQLMDEDGVIRFSSTIQQ